MEEIAEIISKVSLKQLDAPCILYNLNGYYDHLKALLALMIEKGLSSEERQEGIFLLRTWKKSGRFSVGNDRILSFLYRTSSGLVLSASYVQNKDEIHTCKNTKIPVSFKF